MMPSCPACTTRLLRIFVHDTATTSFLASVSTACRRPFPIQPYTRRLATAKSYSTATSTTSSSSSAPTITRCYQQTRVLSQHYPRKNNGVAYGAQKRLSDDDYMPFITELPPPPPPPLRGLPMMSGMLPGVPRVVEGDEMGEWGEGDKMGEWGEGMGFGVQEGGGAEWKWEQERNLVQERMKRVEDIVGRASGGGRIRLGRIRPGKGGGLRAAREIEEIEDEVYVRENVEDEVYVGENMEEVLEKEQKEEEEEEEEEVAKGEERLSKVEQKKEEFVYAAPESTSTAVTEEKVQSEEHPVRSRKENRLARKERRQKKKLEELQALEGSEGMESFMTKGALHFSQRYKKALFGKKDIEAQVKAQVFKKMEELASDPATPPPLLPVRGTLPASSEKIKPNVAQPQTEARTGRMKAQVVKKMEEPSLDPVTSPQLLAVRGIPIPRPKVKSGHTTNVAQPQPEARASRMKAQVVKKMEEPSLDPVTPPQLLSVRSTLPTPRLKVKPGQTAASTHKRFMDRAERRALQKGLTGPDLERPKYKGFWTLPTIDIPPPPGSKPKKKAAIPPALKSLVGTKPTPESILRNSKSHPSWVVQKAALQKKFNGTPWQARKKISPGTVSLIKAINAEAPHVLKAQDIAAKFKISLEAARRILRSKRVMLDEEKERKPRKWIERGERIRMAKVESGEIWTKERRRDVWEVKEKWRKIREMNEKFGIEQGKKEGEGAQVERSLGRINWEGKFV